MGQPVLGDATGGLAFGSQGQKWLWGAAKAETLLCLGEYCCEVDRVAHGQGIKGLGSVSGGEAPEKLKGPRSAKCKGSFRVCSHDNSTWEL